MKTFEHFNELAIPSPLLQSLDRMSFQKPTPVQAAAIPAALGGRDILGTAQTGTGKTGAFGVPLLDFLSRNEKDRALVLAPTRELAAQIHGVLTQMGNGLNFRGVLLVGGESFHRQSNELANGTDYIIATPGRLIDHLQQGTVNVSGVSFLVLDEVDRMLDMGFLPQIRQIERRLPTERQTLLFSATLPTEITSLAGSFLKDPVRVAIGPVAEKAPQVTEETIHTSQVEKNEVLLREVAARQGKLLIFARTKSRADRLTRLLEQKGHRAMCLHGGKSQSQRRRALEQFRAGRPRILVATDLAGRGIDVPDIEHVINYDTPNTRDDYVHRIGRTGRFGRPGRALNLVVPGESTGRPAPRSATSRGNGPRTGRRPGRGRPLGRRSFRR